MAKISTRLLFWLRISFFNLLLVAFIGLILRYKIAFSLPLIDQKHLLHGHSHFAFAGWISMALMAYLIAYVSQKKEINLFPKYKWLLWGNLITAYGMLFSFPFQGYGIYSIIFSALSIINSWIFAVLFWKELNGIQQKSISINWFKSALFFNAISAFGAFGLAYMMANKIIHQNWYLLAVYFYLHFQYNGWFFFTCMGLFIEKITAIIPNLKNQRKIFWLFTIACVPSYFLSALWISIPFWFFAIIIISALSQLFAWLLLTLQLNSHKKVLSNQFSTLAKWILLLSGIAATIKFILQTLSTIPVVSKLAFGFRPIVIAYLHLILLGLITLFIISYFISSNIIKINKTALSGIFIFIFGIILNEFLLLIQGITAILETSIPFINELLLIAALFLFSGMLLLNLGIKAESDLNHN